MTQTEFNQLVQSDIVRMMQPKRYFIFDVNGQMSGNPKGYINHSNAAVQASKLFDFMGQGYSIKLLSI